MPRGKIMLEIIRSNYHLFVVIILGIYLALVKFANKRIVVSHAMKAKTSFFVLIFSAVTIWIASISDISLTDQIQKIMTTFFVVSFALIWLASDFLRETWIHTKSKRED